MATTAITEVDAEKDAGGLPQLDFATYEEQLVWLFLSFIVLFVIVSRFALPKIGKVLEEREERIADDLDRAERLKKDAEEVKASYEEAVADARSRAQHVMLETKAAVQADIAKAQSELDAKLMTQAEEAEARIAKAKDDALAGLGSVAEEVAVDMIAKLTGNEADQAEVSEAVSAALNNAKGA